MRDETKYSIAALLLVSAYLVWIRKYWPMKKSYFTIEELCRSAKAQELGLDNTPTPQAVANMQALISNVLDPARKQYGNPIYVNSGYRSQAVNAAVGGASTSQHLSGQAADITTGTVDGNRILFSILANMDNYDQLIWEGNGAWIHVSYKTSGNRRSMLAQTSTGYVNIKNNWQTYIA